MNKVICLVIISIFSISGISYAFDAKKEADKYLDLLKKQDNYTLWTHTDHYQMSMLKIKKYPTFQQEDMKKEGFKNWYYPKAQIVNANANLQYVEFTENGDAISVYYKIKYNNEKIAGYDYDPIQDTTSYIKSGIISVGIYKKKYQSISLVTNPKPEYWRHVGSVEDDFKNEMKDTHQQSGFLN